MKAPSSPRLRFLLLFAVFLARMVEGDGVALRWFSKMQSSNLPVPRRVVNIARKWETVLSIGTFTRKRLREESADGILGACGRR